MEKYKIKIFYNDQGNSLDDIIDVAFKEFLKDYIDDLVNLKEESIEI